MGFYSVVNHSCPFNHSYLDGSVVAPDIVDAQEDALAVLLLVSGSEIALKKERVNKVCRSAEFNSLSLYCPSQVWGSWADEKGWFTERWRPLAATEWTSSISLF